MNNSQSDHHTTKPDDRQSSTVKPRDLPLERLNATLRPPIKDLHEYVLSRRG